MINRVTLVGRLTKDPNFIENQVAVANFTVAVNRTFKNKNGEQETDFINVVTFRKQAENVNNYLSKGSLVGIDGRIQTRNYENKEGQRIFVTEVVADSVQFLEPKSQQSKPQQTQAKDNPFANGGADISESELPF